MDLGGKIKKARKSKKLTQKELAEIIGKSTSAVQKYELGLVMPPIEVMQKINKVLNLGFLELGSETENEFYLIANTFNDVGFGIDQNEMAENYYITPNINLGDWEKRTMISHSELVETVQTLVFEAEKKRKEYLRKRLEAELFGWKG